ncbi:MAG: SURF1 family protein [Candidatus Competibacteraceae bacterium]|jgi:surfeit locus 1 family protein|nr:SURF1 family protein [Candidatus Competibacteraceae bacterium]
MRAFSIRVGSFWFKPTLIPSLITLIVFPLLLSLGFWQLSRAHYKAALEMDFAAQLNLPYVPIEQLDLTAKNVRYRKVSATGRYDETHQILLDNQVLNGRPGYHVFTPLRFESSAPAVLVNRGWVPLGASRQQFPVIDVTDAEVTLRGRLAQPANPGMRLTNPSGAQWPQVVQYLDYAEIASTLGYALAPVVILLDSNMSNGYQRDWRPTPAGFGPERHQGYAVQWFALAATLLIIYCVVNTQRSHSDSSQA